MGLEEIVISGIDNVYTIPTHAGRYLEIKSRKNYAVSFCKDDGVIVYTHEGRRTVSHKSCAVILPQGASYTLENEAGGDFPIINFKCTRDFTDKFISVQLKNPDYYIKEFEKISRAWSNPQGKAKAFSLLYGMIYSLQREADGMHPVLSPIMEYISENISDPSMKNTDLARIGRISEVYLRRIFKESFGTSPHQYILEQRIGRAKELLSEGVSSIELVAETCGFSSVFHFSRYFKKALGLTPTEYRASCLGL